MSNILKIAGAGVSAAAEETDPNFNQTVLLLHGDGTDGAQNNTFLDSGTANSGSGFTITRNGNTTQGTFSPFSQPDGRWANFFDGNDHLSLAGSSDFNIAGDFTLEFWFYHTEQSSQYYGLCSIGAYTNGIMLRVESSGGVWYFNPFVNSTTPSFPTAGLQIDANTWYHVAVVRSGTTVTTYLNGSSVVPMTVSGTANSTSGGINIGLNDLSQYWKGYITGFKLVNGTAIAPSGLPTSPTSTSTTNQKLLTCYSNRFVDANTATTAKTVTVNGNPKVTPFSPFAPTAAYSASVNGGSMYQIGATDYVQSDSSADVSAWSTDFTIECWLYPTALSGTNCIWTNSTSNSDGMTAGYTRDGRIILGRYGINETASTTGLIKNNTWHHVAWVRSGSSVNIYLNGVSVATPTTTNLETSTTKPMTVGGEFQTTGDTSFPGYISGFRVLKGTAIDFSSVGVPTAPYQASDEADTKLLLNFTNAGIFDNTGKNNLETVGNAQIDTTTKKYGTGSMEFDGTDDALIAPFSEQYWFGLSDFSVEAWIYPTSLTGGHAICGLWGTIGQSNNASWLFYINGSNIYWYVSTNGSTQTAAINVAHGMSINNWYFVSLIRSSGTTTIRIDGTTKGSTPTTYDLYKSTSGLVVGRNPIGGTPDVFEGFIDDLRITKGIARDGTVVPTKEFPNL